MSLNPCNIAVLALAISASLISNVQASSLEGAQLEAYDASCPVGNYRAVWAELLPGILTGWVNLVCLNEDEQETSYWYVTPEGNVVLPDEAELPVYVRPMVEPATLASITALDDDQTIRLWLDFVYDEPTVPSLEAYGAPAGIGGVSGSSSTGSDGITVSTYSLNGQSVTAAEYEVWQTSYLAANQAQIAERDRLVRQQVQLALYDLVELNQWHNAIDIDAINNGYSEDPFWQFNSSLVITLTGKQARDLIQSGDGLVYLSTYAEASNDDLVTTGGQDGVITQLPTNSSELPVDDEEIIEADEQSATGSAVSDVTATGGGALNPLGILFFTLSGLWARLFRKIG